MSHLLVTMFFLGSIISTSQEDDQQQKSCNFTEADVSSYLLNNIFQGRNYWDRPVVDFYDTVDVNISLYIMSLTDVVNLQPFFHLILLLIPFQQQD